METKTSFFSRFNSLKYKSVFFMIVGLLVALLISRQTKMPQFESQVTQLTEDYMLASATLSGQIFDEAIERSSIEAVLTKENLQKHVQGIKIGELSTSYCYIVSNNGTMLYHPTAEKIGKPVENAAVKQLVGDIANNQHPQPSIIKYLFNDAMKYAAYYISENSDFIVIVTADESDVLSVVNRTSNNSLLVDAIVFILCIAFCFIFQSMMINPIKKMEDIFLSMSKMNFRVNPSFEKYAKRGDEIGLITRSLIAFRIELVKVIETLTSQSSALNQSVQSVDNATTDVLRSSEQVESAVHEIATGATSQAQETQTATESIVEMGQMIDGANSEVTILRDSADAMNIAGRQAFDTLMLLKNANNETKDAIQLISDQTNTTNASAMKIKEAADIITSIAAETNLLSLNASIEAARAGEQGRGFAVVAAQIQKLAEQSNGSAGQITKIINELLEDSAKSVESMNKVSEVIEKQDEYVENTSTSFLNVKNEIEKSLEEIKIIFDKTEVLNEARIKVMDVIQNLSAIAEENAAGTEETSASVAEVASAMENVANESEQLVNIAKKLDDSINVFTLE